MTDLATTQAARLRRERIRLGMHSYITTRRDIADAYAERDWETLGYDSWDAYIEAEFSEARVRLSPDERREAVAQLRLAGMSQRAIGAALGVSQKTVDRDLSSESFDSDGQPDRIQSLDGRERPSTRPAPSPGSTDAALSPPAGPGVTPAPAAESPVLAEQREPAPTEAEAPREGDASASPADAERAAAAVQAALDKFVPDPGKPQRDWQKELYVRVNPVHTFLLWLKTDDVTAFADEDDLTTLRHLATSFADAHRRAVEARNTNVTQLRRIK